MTQAVAYVNKHHCRNLLFNHCTEDVIAYQQAQCFRRVVLPVSTLVTSETVFKVVVKLSQGDSLSYFGEHRQKRDRPIIILNFVISIFKVKTTSPFFQAHGKIEQVNEWLIMPVIVCKVYSRQSCITEMGILSQPGALLIPLSVNIALGLKLPQKLSSSLSSKDIKKPFILQGYIE